MRTKQITVFQFSELSEKAKETAYNRFLNSDRNYFWMDEYIVTIKKGLNHFDCKMGNRWEIDYSCANRSYVPVEVETNHSDDVSELSGVRLFKFIHNNYLSYFCKYDKKVKPLLDGNCPFTSFCGDEYFLQPVKDFMKRPTNITFQDLMELCVYEVLKAMENDYDHQNSLEFFIEECENNGIEFSEDGRKY